MVSLIDTAYSQKLRVESIVELTQDLSARTSPRIDNSGTECAILRINIPSIKEVYFGSTIVGDPIYAPGEYTVYVPANSKRVDLTCEGKPLSIVFSDFQVALQPKSCYRVVVKKELDKNAMVEAFARVKITANYEDDVLLIDGVPVGQLPLYLDDITVGPHTFSIPNTNGRTMKDSVITIKRGMNEIMLKLELKNPQLVPIHIPGLGASDVFTNDVAWGISVVESNGKYGVEDYCGNLIIPAEYDNNFWNYEKDTLCKVYKNKCIGLFKVGQGEVITPNDTIKSIEILTNDLVNINGRPFSLKTMQYLFPESRGHFQLLDDGYMSWTESRKDAEDYWNNAVTIMEKNKRVVFSGTAATIRFDPQYDIMAVGTAKNRFHTGGYDYRLYKISTGKEIVLPSQYRVVDIWYGLIKVEDKRTSAFGFLDKDKKIVIPFAYKEYDGLESAFQQNGPYFRFYNYFEEGRVSYIGYMHGTIVLKKCQGDTIGSRRIGNRTHYNIIHREVVYNTSGKIIAQDDISANYKFKRKLTNGGIVCKHSNGKLGILDSVGNVILPFLYDSIIDYTTMAYAMKNDGSQIGINNKGEIMLPAGKYKEILVDGYCTRLHVLTRSEFLMYDNTGKCVSQIPIAADAHFVKQGYTNGLCHFSIKSGNTIIRRTYDEKIYQIINTKTGKCGFISNKGELVTNCIYDEMSGIIDGFNNVDDDNSMSINMYSANEGFCILRIGDRFGFMDVNGNVVVPLIYTAVTPFIDGEAFVRGENGKWTKIYSKDLKF